MKKTKHILIVPGILILLFLVWYVSRMSQGEIIQNQGAHILQQETGNNTSSFQSATVDLAHLKLEIADTPAERTQGLSGRASLPEDAGLFFVFEQPGLYEFWMKDMKFSIDIMWLDENYKVVGIKENATPESYPQTFLPEQPALYALETNVGFVRKNNIKIGTNFRR